MQWSSSLMEPSSATFWQFFKILVIPSIVDLNDTFAIRKTDVLKLKPSARLQQWQIQERSKEESIKGL